METISAMNTRPKNTDEYIAGLSNDKQAALEYVRGIIRATVPEAEECISYKIPAFRLKGKCFVWFGAAANHCALYGLVQTDKDELRGYDTSGKGTIRFRADDPLPESLLRKLIREQIAGIAATR